MTSKIQTWEERFDDKYSFETMNEAVVMGSVSSVKTFIHQLLAKKREEILSDYSRKMDEIIDWLEEDLKNAKENGADVPKQYGGGSDPRVRVNYLLKHVLPKLRQDKEKLDKELSVSRPNDRPTPKP